MKRAALASFVLFAILARLYLRAVEIAPVPARMRAGEQRGGPRTPYPARSAIPALQGSTQAIVRVHNAGAERLRVELGEAPFDARPFLVDPSRWNAGSVVPGDGRIRVRIYAPGRGNAGAAWRLAREFYVDGWGGEIVTVEALK